MGADLCACSDTPRARRGAFAPTLDPAALAEDSARYGVGDFGRFRVDFAASGAFRDPGPAVLDLERRLLAIDSTHRAVAYLENLSKLIVEASQGNNSGLSRIDVDAVLASLLRARQNLAGEIGQFRDGLDDLKFLLGLTPTAPVVLDRQAVAAFLPLFASIESWGTHPNRRLGDLPRLIDQCPAPGEILLNGEPILARLDKNPELLEEFLKAAAQRAEEPERAGPDRGTAQFRHSARVARPPPDPCRSSIRDEHLKERNGADEMAVRLRDQSFERLFAPRHPSSTRVHYSSRRCSTNWPRSSIARTGWLASGPRFEQSGFLFIATWVIFPTATGRPSTPISLPSQRRLRRPNPSLRSATRPPRSAPFPAQ